MKKIGLFYGVETVKTAKIADKILKEFSGDEIEVIAIEKAWQEDFEKYDCLILGTSTWFDGELPTYWDEIIPELSSLDLKKKQVAIFGLGDQKRYPDNFADGVGILAETLIACGAKLVGFTSPEGYQFDGSRALKDGQFQGLILDIENQSDKTEKRIKEWVGDLKKAFVGH